MKRKSKREVIIRAALELITEYGFHGAPIAAIANKAGVAAGTIYGYFESKGVLITELYREVEENLLAELREDYPADEPVRERFVYLGTALINYFISHPVQFRYLVQYHNSPYGANLRKRRMLNQTDPPDIFRELFQEGIAQKVLKDIPLFMHNALGFGPLISLVRDHIRGLIKLDDALIRQALDACWDGIKR